jgi:hypothetical protein
MQDVDRRADVVHPAIWREGINSIRESIREDESKPEKDLYRRQSAVS